MSFLLSICRLNVKYPRVDCIPNIFKRDFNDGTIIGKTLLLVSLVLLVVVVNDSLVVVIVLSSLLLSLLLEEGEPGGGDSGEGGNGDGNGSSEMANIIASINERLSLLGRPLGFFVCCAICTIVRI